jgi:hypothetical protein
MAEGELSIVQEGKSRIGASRPTLLSAVCCLLSVVHHARRQESHRCEPPYSVVSYMLSVV